MISRLPTTRPIHRTLTLIKTCLESGDLQHARRLFDKIPEPDLRSWTIFISTHIHHGFPKQALKIYTTLLVRKIDPDELLLLSITKACAASGDLCHAKQIHNDAIRFGFNKNLILGNALIDMYGKCKFIDGARRVFDDMGVKDVVSWTSMASCYVNCGMSRQGLLAVREMSLNNVRPNSLTVSSILRGCGDLKDLKCGREIHGFSLRNSMEGNQFVNSALVNMYASCLSLKQARMVFNSLPRRDIVSWNALLTAHFLNKECDEGLNLFYRMTRNGIIRLNHASWNAVITGCVQNGKNEVAMNMFYKMKNFGFKPNQITIVSFLPACTNLESLNYGKEIHGYAIRHWFFEDITIATALLLLYSKCGELELAKGVFNIMPRKDVVTWNTMIFANSMHGNGKEALRLFNEMLQNGVNLNPVTFMSALSGCSHSHLVDEGVRIFNSMSSKYSIRPNRDHCSCMVDVLTRSGRLKQAYEFIKKCLWNQVLVPGVLCLVRVEFIRTWN